MSTAALVKETWNLTGDDARPANVCRAGGAVAGITLAGGCGACGGVVLVAGGGVACSVSAPSAVSSAFAAGIAWVRVASLWRLPEEVSSAADWAPFVDFPAPTGITTVGSSAAVSRRFDSPESSGSSSKMDSPRPSVMR